MDANKMDGVEVMAIINGEVEESMKITEDELALLDQLFDFDHYKFDPDLHVHIKDLDGKRVVVANGPGGSSVCLMKPGFDFGRLEG